MLINKKKQIFQFFCSLCIRKPELQKDWNSGLLNSYFLPLPSPLTTLKDSRQPGKLTDNLESLHTIKKICRLSGNFPIIPECVQTENERLNNSRKFGRFPERHKSFQNIWKVSRQYGNGRLPDSLESFQTSNKAYRQPIKLTEKH